MPVHAKLLEAQQSVDAVVKQGHNSEQNYNYATAADVIAVCRKSLHDAGLVPAIEASVTTERHDFKTKKGTEGLYVEVKVNLKITDPEDESFAIFNATGAGADYGGGDKAPLKAQTAATKYVYANALALPFADHDPEKDVAGEPARPPAGTKPEMIDADRTTAIGKAISAAALPFETLCNVFGAAGADAPKIDRGDSKYKAVRAMTPEQADKFEAKLAEAVVRG